MHTLILLATLYAIGNCANYQGYGESSTRYPSYSTIANFYDQPYKALNYGNDISSFPEATRYPNYRPGYTPSTSGFKSVYQDTGYSTPRYGQNFKDFRQGDYNIKSGYSTPQYGTGFKSDIGSSYTSYQYPFMSDIRDYCVDRVPQNAIWVEQLMGFWYAVEIIQHLGGDSGVYHSETCVVIHIAEPRDPPQTDNMLYHAQALDAQFRQEYRYLRLLWDEKGQTVEFSLYFQKNSAGYWKVLGAQNGTMTGRSGYKQFTGSVQVLKAVNDHLVLHFCQEPASGRPAQLYTVLFSRNPAAMPRWEIESVHTFLSTKKLSLASIRTVCKNTAHRNDYSVLFFFVTSVLVFFIPYHK